MKFKQYLSEGRSVDIDKDTVIKLIKNNCMKNYNFFLKKKQWLFRGIERKSSAYLMTDSNKGIPRVSANTRNYVTLLMDNLPSWKKYPKRSRSIICSTSEVTSKSYGTLYIVIPYDNTNIGIAPDDDIWFSFKEFVVNDFNAFLAGVFIKYQLKVRETSFDDLKNALIQLNQSGVVNYDRFGVFSTDHDVMKYMDKIMSPIYNKFKHGIKNMSLNKEVWVQGKSILIHDDIFWGMMDEI